MAEFVSKRVNIEAVQFTAGNFPEVHEFTEGPEGKSQFAWLTVGEGDDVRLADETDEFQAQVYDVLHDTWVNVKFGQWIIRGTMGEYYPCDPDVFAAKYEPVVEEPAVERPALGSSTDAILRGAEKVWGEAAGHGSIVTSDLPQKPHQRSL